MHDPNTLAFSVPNPFARRYRMPDGKPGPWSDRPSLVDVWHRDPCHGGDENSCDWHGTRKRRWIHPRFHFWHWRIRVLPLQDLKRWLFTRCYACGGRFRFGETGIGTWESTGPRWFRSERLTHMRCAYGRASS